MMIKVSVIMPVYNSQKYLEKAVESVLRQSLKEIQLILVDDGSTDGSSELCDKFAERDNRVTVIHQKNGGICNARNNAIKIAEGEYIAFADNDDECLEGWLEDNYLWAKQNGADMVKFGRITEIIKPDGTVVSNNIRNFPKNVYTKKEIENQYIDFRNKGLFSAGWDGMYLNETIKKYELWFDTEFKYGEEDSAFCIKFLGNCNKIALNSGVYYRHYVRLKHSTSSKFHVETIDKYDKIAKIEKNFLLKEKIQYDSLGYELLKVKFYLLPCLSLLFHDDCNFSYKQKIEYLESMLKSNTYQFLINRKNFKFYFKQDKILTIVMFLFKFKYFFLLLQCTKVYKGKKDKNKKLQSD